MGGRSERDPPPLADREKWITEVSNERLSMYERMLSSPDAARVREDGSARRESGAYFRDLIQRERERRNGTLL